MSIRYGLNNHYILAPKGNECSILNFTNQGIKHIEIIPNASPTSIIYDKNAITQIENLQQYEELQQLSVAENQLTDMTGVSKLCHLTVLNLPSNHIHKIEGLQSLQKLVWLNLAGNHIRVIENIQGNTHLQHLDLSDNHISALGDLSQLKLLKTLLLHGNVITTLRSAPQHLSKTLQIVSLAKNNINDLSEIGYLSSHTELKQLSILDNPCVLITENTLFDYRPYVLNWCLNLEILDGYLVSKKEGLKAEWLYSQGKGRHFRPGQHQQLIHYLANVSPITASNESEKVEDAHLSRVLQQQRLHQEELLSGNELTLISDSSLLKHATSTGSRNNSPRNIKAGTRLVREDTLSTESAVGPGGMLVSGAHSRGTPGHAWSGVAGTDASGGRQDTAPRPEQPHQTRHPQDMQIQDVSSSDECQSLLECETRYLPLHSELSMSPVRPLNLGEERPRTAPATTDKPQGVGSPYVSQSHQDRPSTALPGSQQPSSRYEQYENRPLKGVSQGRQSRLAANFGQVLAGQQEEPAGEIVRPTPSDQPPTAHSRKRSQSPLAKALEILELDSDQENKSSDSSNTNTLELKLLKALLASRKSKKDGRASRDCLVSKSYDNLDTQSSVSTSQSSPYKSQYTPEKYTSPTRRQVEKASQIMPARGEGLDRGSGDSKDAPSQNSQIGATENLMLDDPKAKEKTLAATKLQALWRGFMARQKDPNILKVRQEIRAKRAEEHITHLSVELEKQRQLYEQEKQLRAMQLEALKHLWKQVQSLQEWKEEVVMSQEQFAQPPFVSYINQETSSSVEATQQFLESLTKACGQSGAHGGLPSASAGPVPGQAGSPRVPLLSAGSPQTTMAGSSGVGAHPGLGVDINASQASVSTVQTSQKEAELEGACKNLQKQVSQLQDVLGSMSNLIFQGGIISAEPEAATGADSVRLSVDFDNDLPAELSPKSKSPKGPFKYTVAISGSNRKAPALGVPTPPENLRVQAHSASSVVLFWQPSHILNEAQQPVSTPIMGYRVYLNGTPRAMLAGTQNKALLEGLNPSNTYRITVRGVSMAGESADSNIVIISSDSDTEDSDNSSHPQEDDDKDHDSPDDKGPKPPKNGGESGGSSPGGPPAPPPDGGSGGGRTQGPASSNTSPSSSPGGANTAPQPGDNTTRISSRCLSSTSQIRRPMTATLDLPATFVKDKSPSGDSGYWTSPTSTLTKQAKASGVLNKQVQETVQEGSDSQVIKKTRRSAIFERLEKLEQKLKSPVRTRDFNEDPRSSHSDDNSLRKSIANILDQKKSPPKTLDRFYKKDITPTIGRAIQFSTKFQADDLDGENSGKLEDLERRKVELLASKIPVLVRKDSTNAPSPNSTKSDMELTYTVPDSDVRPKETSLCDKSEKVENARKISTGSDGTRERRISWEFDKAKERKHSNDSSSSRSSRKSSLSRRPSDAGSSRSGHDSSSNNTSPANTKELSINVDDDKASDGPSHTPKPPDGPTSPRKPSIGRRNSFKKNKEAPLEASNSDVDVSSKTSKDTKKSVADQLVFPVDKKPDMTAERAREVSKETLPVKNNKLDQELLSNLDSNPADSKVSIALEVPTLCVNSGQVESSSETVSEKSDDLRGRKESRSKKEKSERRASSLGAIMNRLNSGNVEKGPLLGDVVIDKPPIGKILITRDRTPERRTHRRRTKSEQGSITSSEDEGDGSSSGKNVIVRKQSTEVEKSHGVYAVVRRHSKRDKGSVSPKIKTAFSHKRSSSDLSALQALPDRPESPAPKDKKVTPSVPMQAPSSPRVRRSSSFSKALPGNDSKNPNAILRQCISLETLKAAKNREGRARHKSDSEQTRQVGQPPDIPSQTSGGDNGKTTPPVALTQPPSPEQPPSVGNPPTTSGQPQSSGQPPSLGPSHRRSHSHGTPQNMMPLDTAALKEEDKPRRSAKIYRRPSLKDDRLLSAQREKAERVKSPVDKSPMPVSYSPRVGSQKLGDTPTKNRKPKTTNKAADLFAKLQLRLSSSKM